VYRIGLNTIFCHNSVITIFATSCIQDLTVIFANIYYILMKHISNLPKIFSVFIFAILLSGKVSAQQVTTGTIKGFVYDKSTGEPMIFTNVLLKDTKMGAQTDVDGYFTISQVPEGTYTLFTSLIGYDTFQTSISVKAGGMVTKKLFLSQKQTELGGVEITARRTEKVTQINAGTITVTPREMKMLPSTGGEPDIAQYLQVVPGVIFTGDQGGQLYIRGGSPTQTGILLDGITIYNPFHSIGLYSVFETDAIRNVEIQTAGFNAQYGNRTSAIVDITTKDGNKNRLAGKASISPLMARVMLEGPLIKAKKEGGASSTFLLSTKYSYLDKTSKSIYGGLGEPFKTGLPYSFMDIYGKVTVNADNGSKLNLFGFNFDDKAKSINPNTKMVNAEFNWQATGAGATFVITPGTSSALINGRFAYSKYNISANEATFRERTSSIDGFEGGIDFTYFFKGYSQLKYGIEVSGMHTALDYQNAAGVETTLDRRNTMGSLFVMYRKNFGEKFIFEPGLRVQYYSSLDVFTPEPRLGMKYNITDNVRLKAAGGLYSQNILSTKSDRDIVNFFNGFVLSPDQAIVNTEGERVASNLQRAYHAVGGIEVDIQNVELNLEPWYKNFYQNIELSRTKINVQDPDFTAGTGNAKGIDLSARYAQKRIYLWGVVSYQQVVYKTLVLDGNKVTTVRTPTGQTYLQGVTEAETYPPPFDRRWNINLLGSYTAGKKKDWEISVRFNFGSPFPFTQTQGFYEKSNIQQNGIATNYPAQNGQIGIIYANDINGGRLSAYNRLDLSARKRFELSKNSNIETTLSLTNVYDRNNIFYIERLDNTRVFQLPLFPSLNATWNF